MYIALASKAGITQGAEFIEELVERLKGASRYEQAADLMIKQRDFKLDSVVECLLKANKFLKAYQIVSLLMK